MIEEFEGKKFKTRDGKYDADIVQRRKVDSPYVFWAVLTQKIDGALVDRAEIYLETLERYSLSKDTSLDLIEVKEYDWPLWAPVYAWDGDTKPEYCSPSLFAGVKHGQPRTFQCYSEKLGEWMSLGWDHAERIEVPNE